MIFAAAKPAAQRVPRLSARSSKRGLRSKRGRNKTLHTPSGVRRATLTLASPNSAVSKVASNRGPLHSTPLRVVAVVDRAVAALRMAAVGGGHDSIPPQAVSYSKGDGAL